MTAYQGGKKRIGKKIHDVIVLVEENLSPFEKLPYFEPFVGMGGVLRHFGKFPEGNLAGSSGTRELHASDVNTDLIMMWKALKRGWKPPLKCSRKQYETFKNSNKHSADRAFVGFVASYGNNFFNNYRLDFSSDRNYLKEGYDGLMKILPDIRNVKFENASYDEYDLENFLIYCDPPYKNNKLNSIHFNDFDHKNFWNVMRKWSKNNIVIISESSAPKDFKKIWTTQSYFNNQYKGKKYADNLYIHENLYKKLTNKNLIKNLSHKNLSHKKLRA